MSMNIIIQKTLEILIIRFKWMSIFEKRTSEKGGGLCIAHYLYKYQKKPNKSIRAGMTETTVLTTAIPYCIHKKK